MLQDMNTADDKEDNDISVCANCGKEGSSNNMNICNKCKQVKYCNASCKKKHRHKHNKECDRQVAELHDEKLFKQLPPKEDCPICFLPLPLLSTGSKYKTCCGKMICSGCVHAPVYDNQGNKVDKHKCPFCRTPTPTSYEELVEKEMKRMEKDDPIAIYNIGHYCVQGIKGFTQDYTKALEHWHRAGELGDAKSYGCIGYLYEHGEGVEVDMKKATHYYELAAMGGSVGARHLLGIKEARAGNIERALKHFMIAVRSGDSDSVKKIKDMYTYGDATKDDYSKALQAYQSYLGEIKSVQRDEAAAFDSDRYCYY